MHEQKACIGTNPQVSKGEQNQTGLEVNTLHESHWALPTDHWEKTMPINKKLYLTFISSKYNSKIILKRKKNRFKNFIQVRDEGGEGNGNPLQCSCLENSMDRGAWWAAVQWGHRELDRTEWLTHTQEMKETWQWILILYNHRTKSNTNVGLWLYRQVKMV